VTAGIAQNIREGVGIAATTINSGKVTRLVAALKA
jgi:anthranilate phosphoribosyltransferase